MGSGAVDAVSSAPRDGDTGISGIGLDTDFQAWGGAEAARWTSPQCPSIQAAALILASLRTASEARCHAGRAF
jgi:hypothetical protein